MARKRAVHCANCGEYLCDASFVYYGPESCGKPDCERVVRQLHEAAAEDRRRRAERDDFMRYER